MTTADQVKTFARCVYAKGDWVEIRLLHDGKVRKSWWKAENILEALPDLEAANADGWNVYVGPNPRTEHGVSGDKNVQTCRCLFVDFDHIDADGTSMSDVITCVIEDAGMPDPTLLLCSGHGIHAYWRLETPIDPGQWSEIQPRLNQRLGSDPAIRNPERIMRVPGFMNRKPPQADSYVVASDYNRRYDLQRILSVLPVEVEPQPVGRPAKRDSGYAALKGRALLYSARWDSCQLGERNTAAFRHSCTMLNDYLLNESDSWEIVADWNVSNSPPLDDKELREAFESAKTHAKKPAGSKVDQQVRTTAWAPQQAPEAITTTLVARPSSDLEQFMSDQIDGRHKNVEWPWLVLTESGQCLTPGTRTMMVGGVGASKSFMLLQAARFWVQGGHKIAVLECEKQRNFHLARLFAQCSGVAEVTKPRWVAEHPEDIRSLLAKHKDEIDAVGRVIHVAPKQLTTVEAANWVEQQAKDGCKIICIDPVTALHRKGDIWREDGVFVDRVGKISDDHKAIIVFVTHPAKGFMQTPSLDNMAGASAWNRFPDAVFWLESHDPKSSVILGECGRYDCEHNRTVHMLKTRSGEAEGWRLAYNFSVADGLVLHECGFMVKQKKRRTVKDDGV